MWVFAISPRSSVPSTAWREIDATIRLADRYEFTGILAHTGNDTLVDPWLVGQHALAVSERLRPLIAVNPVYHHPFAVAQSASSLTYRYGRGIFLNLVAGTSTPDRIALGDEVEHDLRYARLLEFGRIVLGLLGTEAPLNFQGAYYRLRGARLRLPGPPSLRPVLFIAGQSDAARKCAAELGAVRVGMAAAAVPPDAARLGGYAGLIVRETDEEAWQEALRRFPADPDLESAGASALRYTDAVWRHQAFADADGSPHRSWLWHEPMRTLRADCPYLVGGVDTLAPLFAAYQASGCAAFILDLAPWEDDYAWAARLLERAVGSAGLDAPPADRNRPTRPTSRSPDPTAPGVEK